MAGDDGRRCGEELSGTFLEHAPLLKYRQQQVQELDDLVKEIEHQTRDEVVAERYSYYSASPD